MSTIPLFECLDLFAEGSAPRVDREAGVIRGVKLLGWKSANGREYLPEGVDPRLYEGRVVNANHVPPGQQRSVYDRFGRVVNAAKRPDGVYGDLEVLKSHGLAPMVFEAAERMPGVFGLSHTAQGRERPGSHGAVIESVQSVESVDLVGDPATVAGLFESRGFPMKVKLSVLVEQLKQRRPGYSRALKEMVEAGLLGPEAEMEAPAGDAPAGGEAADHEQALRQGFRAAIIAALDDESMDLKSKLKKIAEILKTEEKMLGGDGGSGGGDGGSGGGDTEEQRRRRHPEAGAVEVLERRLKARDLCTDAGIVPGKTLRKALDGCATEAEMRELIEEARASAAGQPQGQKPRSAPPWQGQGGQQPLVEGRDAPPPVGDDEGRKKRVAGLRGGR